MSGRRGRGGAACARGVVVLMASCHAAVVTPPPPEPVADGAAPGLEQPGGGFALPTVALPDAGPCSPIGCAPRGGKYCGVIGDGCGGRLACGGCPKGLSCGGGGIRGLCGKPPEAGCVPITCAQLGGRLCGRVGDGCGGALECGACPGGTPCGADNVCGGSAETCRGLCRQQVACPDGGDTTVSGTVVAPTPARFGQADPLYNVLVYVPNAPLAPFRPGVACEKCGEVSGAPLVTALTGPDGAFTLHNVPAGEDIPLVVQIGRWRRQVKIPRVTACTHATLPTELTRLPRKQSEGDLPRMAIGTGTWDPFDCTLRKIGIDEAEFTLPGAGGRVSVFAFGGNTLGPETPQGQQLTGSREALAAFDIVLLPCDSNVAKPPAAQGNLVDYANRGGRIFLTDWGYSWLQGGPLGGAVTWKPQVLLQGPDFVGTIDQTFPKGMAFATWLALVGGAGVTAGQLPIHDPYQGASNVEAVVPPTQRWVYTEGATSSIQHFTFNAPIGAPAAEQCGRVVFSQFHVAHDTTIDLLRPLGQFPASCDDRPMTPQEKALEFMLFDASSCIQPDAAPPRVFAPPPPPPPRPPPVIN